MSYCRWSSDNWRCDVYVYESCHGGFDIHVAGNRVVGEIPRADLELLLRGNAKAYSELHKAQMEFLENAERKDIGLQYDGESYNEPDLEHLLRRLSILKKEGYNVPEYVFDTIEKEMTDEH